MGGAFLVTARAVLRRAARAPAPIDMAALYLTETLEWLGLWDHSAAVLDDGFDAVVPTQLPPQP